MRTFRERQTDPACDEATIEVAMSNNHDVSGSLAFLFPLAVIFTNLCKLMLRPTAFDILSEVLERRTSPITQSTRVVISSTDSPLGQLGGFQWDDWLEHRFEDQPICPDSPVWLLGPNLVGFQSLIISVVPFANELSDDVIRCLREVARQEMESIVGTTAG